MYLKRETKLTQFLLDWNRLPPQKGLMHAIHTIIHSLALVHVYYIMTIIILTILFRHEAATDAILVDLQLWF